MTLSAAELASMRSTAASALPGTAVIQSATLVSDDGGGGSVTWTASGTVDCRLAPIRADERETAGRISADAEYVVTLPFDAAVGTDKRLVIDDETYNIAGVLNRTWNLTTRVAVKRQA